MRHRSSASTPDPCLMRTFSSAIFTTARKSIHQYSISSNKFFLRNINFTTANMTSVQLYPKAKKIAQHKDPLYIVGVANSCPIQIW